MMIMIYSNHLVKNKERVNQLKEQAEEFKLEMLMHKADLIKVKNGI